MTDALIYRPNQRNWGAVPAGVLCSIMGAAGIWANISHLNIAEVSIKGIFCCTILLIAGIAGTVMLVKTAAQALRYQPDKLVLQDGKSRQTDISWQDFPFLYRAKSFQGQEYLILSTVPREPKELQKLANRSAWTLQIQISESIVFWDNSSCQARNFIAAIEKQYHTEH